MQCPFEGIHEEEQFFAKVVQMISENPDTYSEAFETIVGMIAMNSAPVMEMVGAIAWLGVIQVRDDGDRQMRLEGKIK